MKPKYTKLANQLTEWQFKNGSSIKFHADKPQSKLEGSDWDLIPQACIEEMYLAQLYAKEILKKRKSK